MSKRLIGESIQFHAQTSCSQQAKAVEVGSSYVADDLLMRLTCWFVTTRFAAASAEKQCFLVRAVNGYDAHFEPDYVAGKR